MLRPLVRIRIACALLAFFSCVPAALAQGATGDTPSATSNEALADQNRALMNRMHAFEEEMQRLRAQVAALQAAQSVNAPEPSGPGEPYAWGDFTWLNGGSRMTHKVLDTKWFTPQFDVDLNYTYSFNHPIDDTLVGSTATFRHNELELAFLGVGGDFHIGHARGRLFFQFGERAVGIPRNDPTTTKGQYNLQTALQYLSEAYAGWHFDKLHGINVDIGEFFSYVGLFSYLQYENWGYQASFTSDNTPWFFVGNRDQLYITDRFKLELWIINGWQSYGKFNQLPGFGFQTDWRPREWMKVVFSGYVGWDTQDAPGRTRFHTDNSLLIRYYNKPGSRGLSRIASSLTFDLGFEQGDGVTAFHGAHTPGNCTNDHPCEQDFVSSMLYYTFWFERNHFSAMVGGGFMRNPGRYLVLTPTGLAAPGAPNGFSAAPGTTFFGWDTSQNISWYPMENLTVRLENSFHHSDDPYYAGPGGVTGPDGYKCGAYANPDGAITTCAPSGWKPDLVHNEDKIILALIFRM
jgi:hypothetical protein